MIDIVCILCVSSQFFKACTVTYNKMYMQLHLLVDVSHFFLEQSYDRQMYLYIQ